MWRLGISLEGADEVIAERLVEYIQQLTLDIELKTRLTEVGITAKDVPMLAEDAMVTIALASARPEALLIHST